VAIRSGQRLGPYEIPSAIGAVGRREVCRAPDSHRNPDLVLKVLPQTVATDPDCMARFKCEARVLGSLNHSACRGAGQERQFPTNGRSLVESQRRERLSSQSTGCSAHRRQGTIQREKRTRQ
jgi:serine/threonine protein kinase